MDEKLLFDLRDIDSGDLKDELTIFMDSGYIPDIERTLAKFAGKIVQVTFRELKIKKPKTK